MRTSGSRKNAPSIAHAGNARASAPQRERPGAPDWRGGGGGMERPFMTGDDGGRSAAAQENVEPILVSRSAVMDTTSTTRVPEELPMTGRLQRYFGERPDLGVSAVYLFGS